MAITLEAGAADFHCGTAKHMAKLVKEDQVQHHWQLQKQILLNTNAVLRCAKWITVPRICFHQV